MRTYLIAPIIFLATALAVTFVGCSGDPAPKPAEAPPDNKLLVLHDVFDVGSAAEARMWTMRDGSEWVVVGQEKSFVVFVKEKNGWEMRYTNTAKPALIPVQATRALDQ